MKDHYTADENNTINLDRRTFLRTGLIGGAILATTSTAFTFTGQAVANSASGFQFFTPDDIPFVKAVLLATQEPGLSRSDAGFDKALEIALTQFDWHCSHLSTAMQKVLRQLLDVATLPLTRGLTTGVWQDWETVDLATAQTFMERWKNSRIFLFRMAHASLVQLSSMVWYGQPESFSVSHYPGPLYPEVLVTEPNNY
ncbi:hypothetical protein [Parendozoicomonas haliclonae]|uniref:Gluconate 2-dehydrogenase subunit 3 n=1 Tax=Parendozoicomonas haliclonae TaxID=1960125 RepID=A0A1X7AL24_9GAMM|nr:hypothetical protein [Parendozoicomonas haliclonae]SMA48574.1 hypothetical protein EHSB41UT_02788 [Parendozoicomonas haliclonae]